MKRHDVYYDAIMMRHAEDECADGPWVQYEDVARILAQRDRLAELLRIVAANGHAMQELHDREVEQIASALAELDKEEQS